MNELLALSLGVVVIISLSVYTIVAIRNIWREQERAASVGNELVLKTLRDTHAKLKAANDQTEKNVREHFAKMGIPFPTS